MATRVYSPTGEPFDIPRRDLADKLILEDGWTQSAPVPKPVEEAEAPSKPKRRSRRKAPVEELESDEISDQPADADETEETTNEE